MNSLTRAFGVQTSTKRSNKGCNGSLGGVLMHKILEGSGNGVEICLCLRSDENGDSSPSVCLKIGHDCYFSGYKNKFSPIKYLSSSQSVRAMAPSRYDSALMT